MHLFNIRGTVSVLCQKRLDDVRITQNCIKRYHVTEMNCWRRSHVVGFVLLNASVPQRHFLLIIEPVLIVRAQTGIEHPLLKT